MTIWETARSLSILFAGRQDAHFVSAGKRNFARRTRVTVKTFHRHLTGVEEIGTYPVTDLGYARWGCIDIDEESLEKAEDIRLAWRHYGVSSWIERSRSKGYHVWVFTDRFVPAWLLRRSGQWINYVSEVEAPEVNPKNVAPWKLENGLVNTVRTPYSGQAMPGRMVMLSERGRDIAPDEWTTRAFGSINRKEVLYPIAQRWDKKIASELPAELYPENRNYSSFNGKVSAEAQAAAQILAGKRMVLSGERDNQFWTMANYLRERQTSYPEAVVIIERIWAEQLLDKYDFSLDDARRKVDRAYGKRTMH